MASIPAHPTSPAEDLRPPHERYQAASHFKDREHEFDSVKMGVWLFLATEIEEVPREVHGPEETHMDVLEVDLDEAVRLVLDGSIHDAKTVIGLLLTERKLREASGG